MHIVLLWSHSRIEWRKYPTLSAMEEDIASLKHHGWRYNKDIVSSTFMPAKHAITDSYFCAIEFSVDWEIWCQEYPNGKVKGAKKT